MIMDRQDSSTVAVPPQHSPSIKQESPKSIAPPVKRKRVRIPKSCIPCLRGKRACDRERPACGRCVRAGQAVECSYDSRLETISSHRSKKLKGEKNDDSDDSSDQESHEILKLRQQLRASEQIVKELQMQLERGRLGSSDMRRASGSDTRRQRSPNYSPEQSHPRSVSHLEEHSKALQGPSPSDGLLMLAEISRSERASEMYRQASSSSSSWNVGHHSTSATAARNSEWPVETTPRSANGAYLARIRASSGTVDANTNSRGRNSLSPSTERSGTPVEDVKSPRNMNGQHIYFGDGAANYPALREVVADQAEKGRGRSSEPDGSEKTDDPTDVKAIHRDVQTAFDGLLNGSGSGFPFSTIWPSSRKEFLKAFLPHFPKPDEFDVIMQSFLRHFAALFPALSSPNAVTAAREFSHRSIEEQEKVPLPALAVFLMIIAIGKNCDLDTIASAHTSPESSHGAGAVAGKSSKGRDISTKTVTIDSDLEADLFLSATYQSLRLCSFLSSPTLQTIHAQLLIGAYLMNTERISTYWPLLGSISRQAQSIGLHIDPSRSRIQYDPVEADMRRRLWWTIVHQDCILSSIFGRPLAISKFSCQKPGTIQEPALRTYSRLQCEFAELQRVYLDEAQDRSWSQEQCESYTRKMLDWYENLPSQYRLDFGDLENLESDPDHQLPVKFPEACLGNGDKGLTTLHQSCVFATKLHYILLSLHKSNLVPPDARRQKGNLVINDFSLKMCARSLRVIARTQKVMHDHLGSTRAGMFWSVAFYVFHAAVAGAYITFLMPTSRMSSVVYKDMVSITKSFERAPERWPGLRTAKGGLRVLRKLATAAMNNPRAARKSKASDRKQDLKAPVPRSSRTEETPSPSSASQVQTGSTPTMNTFLNFNSENINNMLENGFSTVSNPTSSAPAGNGEVAVFAGVGGNGNPFNSNLVSPGSALPDSFFAFDPTFSDQFDPLNMMSTPGDLGAGGTNSNHYASNNHNNGSGSSSSRDLGHSSALPTLNVPTANQSTAMSSSSFFQTHPNLIGNLFSSVNVENAEDGPSSVTNGFNESGGGVGGGITGSAFEAIGSRTSVMTDSYGPMVVPQGTNGLSSDPKDMLAYWSDYFSLQLDIDLDSLSNFV